jgi:uncharacterized protein
MITWAVLLSGFTLGFAGSLHCVGMCGPLSLALPTQHLSPIRKFTSLLLYQTGRIVTYGIIGLVFGLAGRQIYLSGYQQLISMIMGLSILGVATTYFIQRYRRQGLISGRFYKMISKTIAVLLRKPGGLSTFLLLGAVNGLLPCGMVYIALLATLSFSETGQAIGFMTMFGVGTLPAMMLVSYAAHALKGKSRLVFRQVVPFFILLTGVLLVLRGMNLGIPFISPAFPVLPGTATICHP